MDPLMVQKGYWYWLNGGDYFGVPVGNFVGWAMVVLLSMGIFRTYEYIKKPSHLNIPERILLLPVIGYGILALIFLFRAISLGQITVGVTGISIMFSIVILNIALFIYRKD